MKRVLALMGALAVFLTACGEGVSKETASEYSQSPDRGTTAEHSEPVVLTLATYGGTNIPVVKEFNASQSDYVIEIVDYSKDDTISKENALMQINAELASGEGPDMFYLWKLGMNQAIYGGKGYLEDLLPYLDGDEGLSREDFVESLLNAVEIDGKLYGTIPSFSIFTMFGPNSQVADCSPSTFVEFLQLAQDRGGVARLIGQNYTAMDFLDTVLRVASDEFVDFSAMTADFDNDNFRALLELCAEFDQGADGDKSGAILNYCAVSSFMETQYYEAYYGDTIAFLGCPSASAVKNYFINIIDQYGINANSKNKDGAWRFIRLLFTEEYQIDEYVVSAFPSFPSNKNALQALAEKSMSTLYDTDEEGNQWEFTQRGEQDGFAYHGATQAQVDQIMALIDSASQASNFTQMIQSIVLEEAQALFAGDASADSTIEKIQNRVDIYLAE